MITTIKAQIQQIQLIVLPSPNTKFLAKCGCFLRALVHVTGYQDRSSLHLVKVPHPGAACNFKVCAYPHPRDRGSDQSPHPIPCIPPRA